MSDLEDDVTGPRTKGPSSETEARPLPAVRSHIRCRDIMTREMTVATRGATLNEVAAMMRDEDTGIIPVVEQDPEASTAKPAGQYPRLAGLITDRDIVVRALASGKNPHTTLVEEVMTLDIHTASPDDRVIDTIRKMGDKQVRRIPVVDAEKKLCGIISLADIALETEADRELAEALEEISSGTSFWSKIT